MPGYQTDAVKKHPPFDYTKLDSITLYKGDASSDIIYLTRKGRYINLVKPKESDKRYYRYDLKENVFERISIYKKSPQKITKVKIKNITGWFTKARLVTKDIHFGRLILFAKHCSEFSRYKSPVRFIAQLGHKIIRAIEEWESLGLRVEEVDTFFGPWLYNRGNFVSKIDLREKIFETGDLNDTPYSSAKYYGYITIRPSDLGKEVVKYIVNHYKEVNQHLLREFLSNYTDKEIFLERDLKKIAQTNEFSGIFHYETQYGFHSRRGEKKPEKWVFGTSSESKNIKYNMFRAIDEYNLNIYSFCEYIKKQKNVEKNDIGYLLGSGHHYLDYLMCEKELCNGKLSKMNKYPDNFRTQFHRTQEEYNILKAKIDEKKFKEQTEKHREIEHIGKKYQIVLPESSLDIYDEALELKHCVRTYIPKVIEGKTFICFLRDKKHLKTPLVTLEVKNGALTQAYGKNDKRPTNKELDFLGLWCRKKNIEIACWKNYYQ